MIPYPSRFFFSFFFTRRTTSIETQPNKRKIKDVYFAPFPPSYLSTKTRRVFWNNCIKTGKPANEKISLNIFIAAHAAFARFTVGSHNIDTNRG
ncbi:hypothetical protein PUN28_001139 [Cardiocondyla obscurior]|uniref:Secreted protein n=1 Tax=Cardiocondyla obscurior TaxID=286306 RepID=A0AAW2H3R1_9HYME